MGCKTISKVETVETIKVDSVVMYDTVYAEHHLIRYDTTYVYDSYKETYAIGKVDTVYNIRVDTIKVATINYIYRETAREATDSAVHAKVDLQKQAATDSSTVEKVVEKDIPLWKKISVMLALVVVAAIFYAVGNWRRDK